MTSTDPDTAESSSSHAWGEPFRQFEAWYAEAAKSEPNDPNAMALATVGADGMPSVRMVLLKGHDEKGFVFYTNYESRKGRQILGAMKGGPAVSLEVAAAPSPDRRPGRERHRCRGR